MVNGEFSQRWREDDVVSTTSERSSNEDSFAYVTGLVGVHRQPLLVHLSLSLWGGGCCIGNKPRYIISFCKPVFDFFVKNVGQ